MANDNSCGFCERKAGLKILLTRFTVVHQKESFNLKIHTSESYDDYIKAGYKKIALPAEETAAIPPVLGIKKNYMQIEAPASYGYHQTILRSGYLYCFDEAKNQWSAYLVSAKGFLAPFPFEDTVPPQNQAMEPCVDMMHQAKALTINIAKPKQATKVWFRYSDTFWTEKTKAKYKQSDHREQYMQSVDVKKWISGADDQGLMSMTRHDLRDFVIDFMPNDDEEAGSMAKKSLCENNITLNPTINPDVFDEFRHITGVTLEEYEAFSTEDKYIHAGLVMPIEDPVGLVMDVNAYLLAQHDFLRSIQPKEQIVASMIASLEIGLKDSASLSKVQGSEVLQGQMTGKGGLMFFTQKEINDQTPTANDLQRVMSNTWSSYQKHINEQKYHNALAAFNEAEQQRRDNPMPIEKWYVACLESAFFKKAFKANYDDSSIGCGHTYASTLLPCFENALESPLALKYCVKKLSEEVTEDSILLKAFCLNQKETLDQLPKNNVPWLSVPWDNMINTFSKAIEGKGLELFLTKFIGTFAGALINIAQMGLGFANKALVMMGVFSKTRVTYVSINTSFATAYKELTEKIIEIQLENNHQVKDKAGLRKEIRQRIKAANILASSASQRQVTVRVLLNTEQLSLARSYRQVGQILDDKVINTKALSAGGLTGLVALTQSLFQYAAFNKTMGDFNQQADGSVGFYEQLTRLSAGGATLLATIGDGTNGFLKKWSEAVVASQGVRASQSVSHTARIMKFKAVERFFLRGNIVLALVTGAWDIYGGIVLGLRGQVGVGLLQGLSGAFMISSAVAFAASGGALGATASAWVAVVPGLGWILAAIGIGLTLLVLWLSDDEIQKWLNKCSLGINKGYSSFVAEGKDELIEFKKLFSTEGAA